MTGCVSTPEVLRGEFSSITPNQAKTNHEMNHAIRWSGYVVHTINNEDKTCFEIIETETYENLRPKKIIPKDTSRFLACKDGFLEPQAFNKRYVTITGNLVAYTKQKIDEYLYEYLVVQTDKIYIWSHSRPLQNNFNPIILVNRNHYFCRFNSVGFCL